jgi:ribosomal protein S18 acetylase RimI-like enzyme
MTNVPTSLQIRRATSEKDLNHIRTLFSEYQNWLGVDICFQGFQEELQNLAEKYDCILLARFNDTVCACVGFCPSDTNKVCEIKRLYVRERFRKLGIARTLVEESLKRAKDAGYLKMQLETLQHLNPAIKLYESLGFTHSGTSDDNPLDQIVCMEKSL